TGDDAGFLPVEQRTEAARREEGDGAGSHRHETRPLARPQDVKDERREPVDERRLVQEQGEVEMGSRVVAEDHHLARDLGVPSLVVEERRQLQAERDEHARRQRERDRPSSHAGGAGADGGYEGRPIRYRLRTRLHGGSLCDRPAKVNASRACATLPRPLNMPVIWLTPVMEALARTAERTRVPLMDLRREYRAHRTELLAACERVFGRMQLFGGEEVRAFEAEAAAYLGVRHVRGVASGTDALTLAVAAAGLGAGAGGPVQANAFA